MAQTIPEVTVDDIRSVYPDITPDNELAVLAAIQTARMLVQTSIINNGCGATYTEEQLKMIVIYLAAHQFQTNVGVITSKSAGSASESYQMSTDFFLKGTLHGQNAMLLDSSHCLAQLMADTDLTLQGKQSFPPSLVSLGNQHNRRRGC